MVFSNVVFGFVFRFLIFLFLFCVSLYYNCIGHGIVVINPIANKYTDDVTSNGGFNNLSFSLTFVNLEAAVYFVCRRLNNVTVHIDIVKCRVSFLRLHCNRIGHGILVINPISAKTFRMDDLTRMGAFVMPFCF